MMLRCSSMMRSVKWQREELAFADGDGVAVAEVGAVTHRRPRRKMRAIGIEDLELTRLLLVVAADARRRIPRRAWREEDVALRGGGRGCSRRDTRPAEVRGRSCPPSRGRGGGGRRSGFRAGCEAGSCRRRETVDLVALGAACCRRSGWRIAQGADGRAEAEVDFEVAVLGRLVARCKAPPSPAEGEEERVEETFFLALK